MSHDDDAKNKHFTHERMQIPMEPDDDHGKEIKCHGCDRVMEDSFYGCPAYQFFLHTNVSLIFILSAQACLRPLSSTMKNSVSNSKLVFEPPIINSEDETNHELMLCCICDENILSYWLYYSEEYKQFMHLACFLSSGKRDPETDDGGGGGGSEVVSESSGVGKLETAPADDLVDGNECYFDCPSFYSDVSIT